MADREKSTPSSPPPPKAGREARLAQALRDNLRRRKQPSPPKPPTTD